MSKRLYDEGVASYNAWKRQNKKFEEQGLYGVDFYIKRVEELEEKVTVLEAKLKRKGKK